MRAGIYEGSSRFATSQWTSQFTLRISYACPRGKSYSGRPHGQESQSSEEASEIRSQEKELGSGHNNLLKQDTSGCRFHTAAFFFCRNTFLDNHKISEVVKRPLPPSHEPFDRLTGVT
jgi:hypothetical protein